MFQGWCYDKNLFYLFWLGKRCASSLDGRVRDDGKMISTKSLTPILNYIVDRAKGDERRYLKVEIFCKNMLGLLDTGATRTILGSDGGLEICDLNLPLDRNIDVICKVANGSECRAIGTCKLPFCVRDKVKLIEVLVVPDVPFSLILGVDFFKKLGVVPDLVHDEWYFCR